MHAGLRWLLETAAYMPFAGGLLRAVANLAAVGGSPSGTVTAVNTTQPGITGGPITTAGTLAVQWNGGQVNTLGTGLSLAAGTLAATGIATDAPSDGHAYGRLNAVWAQVQSMAQAPIVSVLSYLPAGQPDGTTDNTAAIQSAINATAGTHTLYFPVTAHNYIVTGFWAHTGSRLLIDGTIYLQSGSQGSILNIDDNASNVSISGSGTLNGNSAGQTAVGGAGKGGVYGSGITNLLLSGLTITNCFNWPLNIVSGNHCLAYGLKMTNCNNGTGFAGNCNDCTIDSCYVDTTPDLGMGFYGGPQNCSIVNCRATNCAGGGIFVLSDDAQPAVCKDILIANNTCYNNSGPGIMIATNVTGNANAPINTTISDNICYGNSRSGIFIQNAIGISITGNFFHANHYVAATPGDLWLSGAVSDAHVDGNAFLNCQIGSTLGFGIACNFPSYTKISNNWFDDNQGARSMAGAMSGSLGHNCVSAGNYFGRFIGAADQLTYSYASTQGFNYDAIAQTVTTNAAVQANAPSFTLAPATGNAQQVISRAAGSYALMDWETAGSLRWRLQLDNTAEGAGNVGSNFFLQAFDNGGGYINSPLSFTRSSGLVTVGAGGITSSGPVSGAGFNNYLASPPAIGGTAPGAGAFTTLSATSTVTIGTNAGASTTMLALNSANNVQRMLEYQTAGIGRWNIGVVGNETGGNSGSDLYFTGLADGTGTSLGNYLSMSRATGNAAFTGAISAAGLTASGMLNANGGLSWQGGNNAAGSIYSDANWGGLFRGRAGGVADLAFQTSGGTTVLQIPTSGVVTVAAGTGLAIGTPTIRSGAGAATGTQPSGSIWMRTDGTAGNRMYVSQGGGTWVAIASV